MLNEIESYVLNKIKEKGGVVIVDKRRVWKQGQSEWVYSNLETIKKCFTETEMYYKNRLPMLHVVFDSVDIKKNIKELEDKYESFNQLPEKFDAEYIFNVNKEHNKK